MHAKSYAILVTLCLIFYLEGIFPHYAGRTGRVWHAVPHVVTAFLNAFLTWAVLAGMTMQVTSWAQIETLGIGSRLSLPPVAETVLIFVLYDVWMYFWHKANHRIGILWRFHRAHHADIAMDTTTALRFHPGELILSTFIRLPIVIFLGMSYTQILLFELILNLSTLFHHSNLAIPEQWDRALRMIVVTPNMHRVHHSVERAETDSNFTSLLSVWDRVFRTFRTREDTRAITIGLPRFREERWQGLGGFLVTPFQ